MDYALQSRGSSRDEEFKNFTLWNYITGSRDDGLHYEEASGYPLINLMRTHSLYPVSNNISNKPPDNLAANYIQFNPSCSLCNLNIRFDGQDGYLWGLKALGLNIDSSYHYTELEFPLDDTGYGEFLINNFDLYDYVILIPSVLSISGDNVNFKYSAWLTTFIKVTSTQDKELINAFTDTSYFYLINNGIFTDTYSVAISDKKGWLQNPATFYDTLDPGKTDTIEVISKIPYDEILLSADTLKLVSTSLSNPLITDSASVILTVSHLRGDANGDSSHSISDIVYLISHLYKGGPAPPYYDTGDANCDADISISDIVYLIAFLFKFGPDPCFPD